MIKFLLVLSLALVIVSALDCDDQGQRCNVGPGDRITNTGFADRFNIFGKRSVKISQFNNYGTMDRTNQYGGKRSVDTVKRQFNNYGVMTEVKKVNSSGLIKRDFNNYGKMDRTNQYGGKRSVDTVKRDFNNFGFMDRTNQYDGKRSVDTVKRDFNNYGTMDRTNQYGGKRSVDTVKRQFNNYGVMTEVKKVNSTGLDPNQPICDRCNYYPVLTSHPIITNNTLKLNDHYSNMNLGYPWGLNQFNNYGAMDRTNQYGGKRSVDTVKRQFNNYGFMDRTNQYGGKRSVDRVKRQFNNYGKMDRTNQYGGK